MAETMQIQDRDGILWAIGNHPDGEFRAAAKEYAVRYFGRGWYPSSSVRHIWAKLENTGDNKRVGHTTFHECAPCFGAVQITWTWLCRD